MRELDCPTWPLRVAAFLGLASTLAMVSVSTAAAQGATLAATSTIRFLGSSPIHDWEGSAPPLRSILTESEPGRWNGELVVPVASLDSEEPARDERMREMFRADRWPEIRVQLRDVGPLETRDSGRLVASVTIGQQTRNVPVRVSNWKQEDRTVSFDAGAELSLEDFGLEAPSVLGFIRVADEVKVRAHVEIDTGGIAWADTTTSNEAESR